jgi:hypothetical protein
MVLKVLPVLMNTFIVIFMNGSMHESINALSIYTQIYRLLIAFCEKYPQIRTEADTRVHNFINHPESRIKNVIPSMGELIPLLGISSYSWNEIAPMLLSEIFDRNIKWVLAQYPELGKINELKDNNIHKILQQTSNIVDVEQEQIKLRRQLIAKYEQLTYDEYVKFKTNIDSIIATMSVTKNIPTIKFDQPIDWTSVDRARIPKTFKANQVSLKLIMFHMYFVNIFRPNGVDINESLFNTTIALDKSYGRANPRLEQHFQDTIKHIKNINSFQDFFTNMNMPIPSNEYLLKWLRQSVLNSLDKRYHIIKYTGKTNTSNVHMKLPSLNIEDL